MKRLLLLFAAVLVSFLSRGSISESVARRAAESWVAQNETAFGSFGSVEDVVPKYDSESNLLYWVCHLQNGSLMVSGDEDITPVLGASHVKTAFDSRKTDFLKVLGSGISRHVSSKKAQKGMTARGASDRRVAKEWLLLSGVRAGPEPEQRVAKVYNVLEGWKIAALGEATGRDLTFWKQDPDPFYSRTPLVNGKHCVNGCTAVALTLVQQYYRFPSHVDEFINKCKVNNIERNLASIEYDYDWDFTRSDAWSPAVSNMIATSVYNSGVALGISYGIDLTSAQWGGEAGAMQEFLGFKRAMAAITYDYSTSTPHAMSRDCFPRYIYPSILFGHPVSLGIADSNGYNGHSVVATGYGRDSLGRERTFVDVGWGGDGDAWYVLPYITTRSESGGTLIAFAMVEEFTLPVLPTDYDLPICISGNILCKDPPFGSISVTVEDASGQTLDTAAPDEDGNYALRVEGSSLNLTIKVFQTVGGSPVLRATRPVTVGAKLFEGGALMLSEFETLYPDRQNFVLSENYPVGTELSDLDPRHKVLQRADLDNISDQSRQFGTQLSTLQPTSSQVFINDDPTTYTKNRSTFVEYAAPNTKVLTVEDVPTLRSFYLKSAVRFSALQANSTVAMTAVGTPPSVNLETSVNGGASWTAFTPGSTTIRLSRVGDSVLFRSGASGNTRFASSASNYRKFSMTGSLTCSGNIMSLLSRSFVEKETIPTPYCFYGLFDGCAALKTLPDLPAQVLTSDCYGRMFRNCSAALLSQTVLPAEEMKSGCYAEMFSGCQSLTDSPEILARNLAENGVAGMFTGCTDLSSIKVHFTEWTSGASGNWVSGVSAVGKFKKEPILPKTTGVNNIPTDWEVIDYPTFYGIRFVARTRHAGVRLVKYGTASLKIKLDYSLDEGKTWTAYTVGDRIDLQKIGDSVCLTATKAGGENYRFGDSANTWHSFVFDGLIAAEGDISSLLRYDYLKSTPSISSFGFYRLFNGCTNLVTAPKMPATYVSSSGYEEMYAGCTALVGAPDLLATSLNDRCYAGMFRGCTSLLRAPAISATRLSSYCFFEMFKDCTALPESPVLFDQNYVYSHSYAGMFQGCSALSKITFLYTGTFQDGENTFDSWVDGVAPVGTFVFAGTTRKRGISAIPEGWTVVEP